MSIFGFRKSTIRGSLDFAGRPAVPSVTSLPVHEDADPVGNRERERRSWVTTMLVTLYSFLRVAMISLIVALMTGSSSLVGSS